MNDFWKLAAQGAGAFVISFALILWVLEGGPLPVFKMQSIKPDPSVPTFQPVQPRLGHPAYSQEDAPELQGDDDPRRTKYRTALKEAIEAVEADHCAMPQKKLLAVAVTAYLRAKQHDIACWFCFWGKSEEEVIRDWSTALDKKLIERLSELMSHGHLAREDFKEPPVLFGLRSRESIRNDC